MRLNGNLGTTVRVLSLTATSRQLLAKSPDAQRSANLAWTGIRGKIGFPEARR